MLVTDASLRLVREKCSTNAMEFPDMSKPDDRSSLLGRRAVLGGTAAVGGLAAAAALLPAKAVVVEALPEAASTAVDAKQGYQLSEHVKRYYATARI